MNRLHIIDGEFGIACPQCGYARKFGMDRLGARRGARRHAQRFPEHEACVTETRVVDRVTGRQPQLVGVEALF